MGSRLRYAAIVNGNAQRTAVPSPRPYTAQRDNRSGLFRALTYRTTSHRSTTMARKIKRHPRRNNVAVPLKCENGHSTLDTAQDSPVDSDRAPVEKMMP